MRLIDADGILKADKNSDKALVLGSGKSLEIAYALLKKKVADAPTVDAVVVTRCKDCKHAYINSFAVSSGEALCTLSGQPMQQDDFCSYGERKDGGDG